MLDLEHRTGDLIQMFQLGELVFRIHNHGTELNNLKHALVQADSLLNEQHRPRGSQLDQDGSQRHDWAENQKQGSGEDYVEESLDQDRPSLSWTCVMRDERRIIKILERRL